MPPQLKGGAVQRAIKSSLAMKAQKRKGENIDEGPKKLSTPSIPSIDDSEPSQHDIENYRRHMSELFLLNKTSAKETRISSNFATKAGATGVEDFSKIGAKGSQDKNAHRDLLRKTEKSSTLPPLYYAEVKTHCPKTKTNKMVWMPMLLVFELLEWLLSKGALNLEEICSFQPGSAAQATHERVCRKNRTPPSKTIPLGIHGDGVESNKQQSVECVSVNICSMPWAERLLFACCEKAFLCTCGCHGRHTIYGILEVFAWAVTALVTGIRPTSRHDKRPWLPSDIAAGRHKPKQSGFGFWAALEQCRADWPWHKFIFGFPGWSAGAICWRCRANRSSMPYYDFSSSAAWRTARYTQAAFMTMLRASCGMICPLFNIPGFEAFMICVDVLHTLDLGVSQEVIGCVLYEFLMVSPIPTGRNKELRLAELWAKMQWYYKTFQPPSRISKLTFEMIKITGSPPRFRAKAADTRHLIPFIFDLALEMYEADKSIHNKIVMECVKNLFGVYSCFGAAKFDADLCSELGNQFLVLYTNLVKEAEEEGHKWWLMKPKFHLMAELVSGQTYELGNPAHFWCYLDETFVGLVSKLASSRGGQRTAVTTPTNVLRKYRSLVQ